MPNREICRRCMGYPLKFRPGRSTTKHNGKMNLVCKRAPFDGVDIDGPPPPDCAFWMEQIYAPTERDLPMRVIREDEC